jgi:hypothetical protein
MERPTVFRDGLQEKNLNFPWGPGECASIAHIDRAKHGTES